MCPKLGVRVSPRSLLRALGQGCQLCFDTKTFSSSCSRLGCSIPGLVWGSGAARLDAAGCASTVMEMSLQTSSLKTTFTRWPDLCGLEPAGATREGFQPPNTPRERGGGRKGGGTSSPSQGGIEEQCSAQRCSEHLHTCGQPRVTQAPAGITQHRGGAAHITPPPAFFGRAAWRVSAGNKALHGLFCRTTRRAFLFYPKMWPRLPWGGREAPKDTDFAPPPSPDSCMELTAWMFSMLPSRTLLMTFYCYYQSPCKEPWDWSSPEPPSWGQ